MMYRKLVEEIVGRPYRHALFHAFPGGLRFTLSEDGSALDQALTALRKATIICEDVFRGKEILLVHVATFAPASRFGCREMLRELHTAGIVIPRDRISGWRRNNHRTKTRPMTSGIG